MKMNLLWFRKKKTSKLFRLGKILREFREDDLTSMLDVEQSLPGPVLRIELKLLVTEDVDVRSFTETVFRD